MKRLYSAQVARPLSSAGGRPTRLGFSTVAWSRGEDLVAVISGCGAVAVFHADAPGEVALLVGAKRAPARHLAWRNAPDKPSMLVVADAAGRLTFWISKDRRVNVWDSAASVELPSVAVAIGWTNNSAALAAVLAHGSIAMWAVPDTPEKPEHLQQQRQRHAQQAAVAHQQAQYGRSVRDPATVAAQQQARRAQAQAMHEFNLKYGNSIVRHIEPKNSKLVEVFGGQIRCGTVAPGGVDPNSVAVVTVAAAQPRKLCVWSVTMSNSSRSANASPAFEVRPLSSTEMDLVEDGKCVAVATVPKHGMLFAVGDRGVLVKWYLKNSRPGGESGWQFKGKRKLEKETVEAVDKGIISLPDPSESKSNATINSTTRALQMCKKRKVYAFDVSSDCKTIVTSSASGLFVWDAETLKVTQGYSLTESKLETGQTSPYWGLCISPGSAAVIALNGEGRVDARSLIAPIAVGSPDNVEAAATDAAERLVSTTSSDGLKGGWDVIASVAVEGPPAAAVIAKTISLGNLKTSQNVPINNEKAGNLKSLMMGIASAEDYATTAAKRLLEVAVDAIRQSAPDSVKLKLMAGEKESKLYASPEAVQKHLLHYTASVRVSTHQLAAVPLADWIMVMCTVWLQRCARAVSKQNGNAQLGLWASIYNIATTSTPPNPLPRQGMVNDAELMRTLRRACLPAAILLALEDEHGEPEADSRYVRFHREESSEIVAAFWEVSSTWDVGENAGRSAGQAGLATTLTPFPERSKERVAATAAALARHPNAARIITANDKVTIQAAERALGLHGSAVGAGFIMSCTRDNEDASSCNKASSGSQRNEQGTKSEWCPYDLVTGRPLPPWAPLRRCIVSGLLAAETTQHKADALSMNAAAPWISKWTRESPLGGRWARVPSLDLERYELLPAVAQTSFERPDIAGHVAGRQSKVEEVLSQPGPGARSMAPPHRHPHGHASAALANPHGSATTAAAAAAAAAAAVAAAHGRNALPPHLVANASSQMSPGIPGMGTNPALHAGMRGPMVSTGGARVQASPGMSTASSTTDPGSSTSKATRKRGATSGTRGRSKKRAATGERTPTASQLSDLADTLAMPGLQTTSSPPPMNALTRNNSVADALSTDTRSTVTAATNATGGQQDTSKPKRSRKRGSKARQQHNAAAAAAAATAAAAAAAAAAGTGVAATIGSAAIPPTVPTPGQSSAAQQGHQIPRPAPSKRQQQMQNQRSKEQVAAAAAAAAAAASAHTEKPLGRNNGMLQGAMLADGMSGPALTKGNDAMAQLGYVPNPVVSGSVAMSPAHAAAAGRDLQGVGNAMMGGVPVSAGAGMPLGTPGLPQNSFAGRTAADAGFNGMPNGQAANSMALLQQLGNAGNGGQLGVSGTALTALALNFGINSEQLTGLSPAELQGAIDALSRRVVLQQAAAMGQSGVGGVQGSPSTPNNPNLMVSAGLNSVDQNAVGQAPGMSGVMGGNLSTSVAHLGQQVPRHILTGAGGMASMGLPMGNPRTSGADSVSSVPTRVNGLGMTGSGIAVGAGPRHLGERSSGAVSGMTGGATVNGVPSQNGPGGNEQDDRGRRIWKGDLHVRGHRNDMMVPCVAIQDTLPERTPLRDASGWPANLQCDSSKLKSSVAVLNELNGSVAQWYVRFAPVDENGNEKEDAKLLQLVGVMVEKKLAFEISCNEPGGIPGTLYLWGVHMPDHGFSLLGVFRPDLEMREMGVDQEIQLMMMGAGAK